MEGTRVVEDDVLLNITGGSIGRSCVMPIEHLPANVNQHVSIIRVNQEKVLPRLMNFFWISDLGKRAIALYQTGGNREGMSADAIANTPFMYYPVFEQQEIVEYLEKKCTEIGQLIASKQRLLAELESYKKSVIYEYVTGKKEVPAEQADVISVVYPYFPATLHTNKRRFAQAILMCRILDQCPKKMGRVKLEKMLFTIENSIGFDFETEYERAAAGPLDVSIYACEGIISRVNKWYTIKTSNYGVSYVPTKDSSKYKKYYDKYFSSYDQEIARIINFFKDYDADEAEITATLFAAWNDFLIDHKQFSDAELVDEVQNNWNDSKKRFSREIWLGAIAQMRESDIVPKGYGKHTVRKSE